MYKFNYAALRGLIREKCGTDGAFADAVGMSKDYVSRRLCGHGDFRQCEILRIVELLEIEPTEIWRYFFSV